MNKPLFILIVLLFAIKCHIYCGNNVLNNPTVVEFIIENCKYKDNNPLYQSESDSINYLLRKILSKTCDEKHILRVQALDLFYNNSIGTFEDITDVYRMGQRRALCFIALALLEDEYRYNVFLNDAKNSLIDINPNGNYIKEYSIIDIIEVVIMTGFEYSQKKMECAIDRLQSNISLLEKLNDDKFLKDYIRVVAIIIESESENKIENNSSSMTTFSET